MTFARKLVYSNSKINTMKKFLIVVFVFTALLGCEPKVDLAVLEGQYSRNAQKQSANVTVDLFVKIFNEKANTYSVVKQSVIQRKEEGKDLPATTQTDKYTAVYKPSTDELYINETGLTYKVDKKNRTISAPNEVYNRISDQKEP